MTGIYIYHPAGHVGVILIMRRETAKSTYLARLQKRKISLWLLIFEKDSTLARKIPNHIIMELEDEGIPGHCRNREGRADSF